MLLVEIDPVGPQPPQAGLDLGHNVMARGALEPARAIHRPGEFGRQHDVLAAVAEDLAEAGLGTAARVAIGVGFVEKGDAEIKRLVHDPTRGLEIDAPAKIVAAEPDRRYAKPGFTKIALLHQTVPPRPFSATL